MTYGSLLEALEELYDRLVCLPDDSTGEREKRLLDYAACLCCGALYTVKGFDREGDDDD